MGIDTTMYTIRIYVIRSMLYSVVEEGNREKGRLDSLLRKKFTIVSKNNQDNLSSRAAERRRRKQKKIQLVELPPTLYVVTLVGVRKTYSSEMRGMICWRPE